MALPLQNLDDNTFQELFEEARKLIPRYAQGWTDHNLSDPGITLIDLFSWLAEMQLYYLNRIPDEHYLKFLKLLGEAPLPAQPAGVDVTFTQTQTPPTPVALLPGAQVAATDPDTGQRIEFELAESIEITSLSLQQVVSRQGAQWTDQTASNAKGGVYYFAFGEEPAEGNTFYLGFEMQAGAFPGKTDLLIYAYQEGPVSSGIRSTEPLRILPSVDLLWEYWNGTGWQPLTILDDSTVALTRTGRMTFMFPPDMERTTLPPQPTARFWIRSRLLTATYEQPPRLDSILVNTVHATHGKTIYDERAAGNGLPFQMIPLKYKPVLAGTVAVKIREANGIWYPWDGVADFDASGPEDRHFVTDLQNAKLCFGDGIHGMVPGAAEEDTQNIQVVRYRVGGGVTGNVAAGKITEILEPNTETLEITNHRPAAGGAPPESLTEAKSRVRRDSKKRKRGVTTGDIGELARQTPGVRIARVKVIPRYHPQLPAVDIPGTVSVVVVPAITTGAGIRLPIPSRGFLQNVRNFLRSRLLVTTNLFVIAPRFVQVQVATQIRIEPRRNAERVQGAVSEALFRFLDPITGGPKQEGWPFGRAVYRSEVYQIIEGVEGVACVDAVTLTGPGCPGSTREKILLRKIDLVYSGDHTIQTRSA